MATWSRMGRLHPRTRTPAKPPTRTPANPHTRTPQSHTHAPLQIHTHATLQSHTHATLQSHVGSSSVSSRGRQSLAGVVLPRPRFPAECGSPSPACAFAKILNVSWCCRTFGMSCVVLLFTFPPCKSTLHPRTAGSTRPPDPPRTISTHRHARSRASG